MEDKGAVCVTGGSGYIASWLIMRLLRHGYSVRATVRSKPESKKDTSYLANLPGASEKLQFFNADLNQPETFAAPIEGCIGVFHVAHPIDLENKESEETITRRALEGTLGILNASLNSKTVRRVVYTSSAAAVMFNDGGLSVVDERIWSDVEVCRRRSSISSAYMVSKTTAERAALEFGAKNGLEVVSLVLPLVFGPFICPFVPSSVSLALAFILGNQDQFKYLINTHMVHIDDVASAYIFLLEYPNAEGRYICSAAEISIHRMFEFLHARYPQFKIAPTDYLKEIKGARKCSLSSMKLLGTGFKFKYGLEEMFDGAIQSCKEKGLL